VDRKQIAKEKSILWSIITFLVGLLLFGTIILLRNCSCHKSIALLDLSIENHHVENHPIEGLEKEKEKVNTCAGGI